MASIFVRPSNVWYNAFRSFSCGRINSQNVPSSSKEKIVSPDNTQELGKCLIEYIDYLSSRLSWLYITQVVYATNGPVFVQIKKLQLFIGPIPNYHGYSKENKVKKLSSK